MSLDMTEPSRIDFPYLYAGSADGRTWVIDASNANDLDLVSVFETPGQIADLNLVDRRLYLSTQSGLRIVDVATPAKPREACLRPR